MKIKGVIFDMDGTLVESLSFWGYLWERIGREYFDDAGFVPSEKVDRAARTMIYVDAMTYFWEEYHPCEDINAFLAFAEDGIESFYKTVASVKPGACELLRHLKAAGVPIVLASATSMKYINVALRALGLDGYMDKILSCADLGHGKEEPHIYYAAAKAVGLAADELCVVEDSYVALETAKAAGFHTVGVYDKYGFCHDRLRAAAEIYIDSNDTLLSLIQRLELK